MPTNRSTFQITSPYRPLNNPAYYAAINRQRNGGSRSPALPSPRRTATPGAGAPDMSGNISQMLNALNQVPNTTRETVVNRQMASPELQQQIQGFQGQVDALGQNMQDAYGGLHSSFNDLLASLASRAGASETANVNAVTNAALSSGLTPLEAAQLGSEASLTTQQAYAPQQAALLNQQASVPVQLQEALAGLQQSLAMPFISNVISPYYQAVAGQESTAERSDPSIRAGLLSQLLAQAERYGQDDLGYAQLQEQARQFDLANALDQARMAAQRDQFGQELGFNYAQLGQQGSQFQSGIDAELQRLLMSIMAQQQEGQADRRFTRGEREASQQYQTREREAQQKFMTGGLDFGNLIGGDSIPGLSF